MIDEDRIALVEKYLGSRTSVGLLIQAWRDLRDALSSYHASLTLEHINHEERARILEEKSDAFAAVQFNMNVELYPEARPSYAFANEPVGPYVELGGES